MGKGARLRKERALGLRKTSTQRFCKMLPLPVQMVKKFNPIKLKNEMVPERNKPWKPQPGKDKHYHKNHLARPINRIGLQIGVQHGKD